MLTGRCSFERGEAQDAVDEIGDVAEAARLGAVAVDGEGLASQGLHHEVGDDTAVVGLEPGAIGVEDADEVGVHAVVAVVGHDGSLREALGFIVDGARADGIDVCPSRFRPGDGPRGRRSTPRWRRGGSQRCICGRGPGC